MGDSKWTKERHEAAKNDVGRGEKPTLIEAIDMLAEIERGWAEIERLTAPVDLEAEVREIAAREEEHVADAEEATAYDVVKDIVRPLVEGRARLAREVERLNGQLIDMNGERLTFERSAHRCANEAREARAEIARLTAVKSAEIAPIIERFQAAFGADTPRAPSAPGETREAMIRALNGMSLAHAALSGAWSRYDQMPRAAAPGEAWERLRGKAKAAIKALEGDVPVGAIDACYALADACTAVERGPDAFEMLARATPEQVRKLARAVRGEAYAPAEIDAITHDYRPGAQDGMPLLADVEAREIIASAPGQIGPQDEVTDAELADVLMRLADAPPRSWPGSILRRLALAEQAHRAAPAMTDERAQEVARVDALVTSAEILGGDSRPTVATHEIRMDGGEGAIVAEQWTADGEIVKRYEVRLGFSQLVHLALNTTAAERAAIDARADWRGVDDANTHAPPRALTEAEARTWAAIVLRPGGIRVIDVAAALLAAFRGDVPPEVRPVPAADPLVRSDAGSDMTKREFIAHEAREMAAPAGIPSVAGPAGLDAARKAGGGR